MLFALTGLIAERYLRIIVIQAYSARFRKLKYRKKGSYSLAFGPHTVVDVRKVADADGIELFEYINYL